MQRHTEGVGGNKRGRTNLPITIGMVGNAKVGKTSLLRRFVKGEIQTPQI